MKKQLLALACLAGSCAPLAVLAQEHSGCGYNYQVMMEDPAFAADQAKFNAYLKQFSQTAHDKAGGIRIIPVVVHVIHDGTASSNVSDASIHTMITKMNQAYSKTPPNINTLPLRFDSIADDALIEFRLATRDPLGNCTDGIRRVYAPHKSVDANDDKRFKRLSYWDRTKYLNIWICKGLKDAGDSGPETILGYAYGPAFAPALADGVALAAGAHLYQATASHEAGHHLNLIHIWGDKVCGDDQVDDTPIARAKNFPWTDPCGTSVKEATCYENVVDNYRDSLLRYAIGENYQNFMDYVSNYNCPNMFTKGQIERMNATLTFYSYRANLVTPANNIATGTQDNAPACPQRAPVAEFWAQDRVACAGSEVNFVDGSFNGTPETWSWTFDGGTPATSTDQNPTVVYSQPGIYQVSLTVTNAAGTSTKLKQAMVFVLNTNVDSKPWGYSEGFESGGNYQEGRWMVINDQTDPGKQWNLSPVNVAYTGSYSVKMNNFKNIRDNNSSLISPAVDMGIIDGSAKQMRFKLAYALRTNSTEQYNAETPGVEPVAPDRLTLSYSMDCGNWVAFKVFTANDLVSAGLSPNDFNPQNLSLWKSVTVPLNGGMASSNNVRFRFDFRSGCAFNNNLFIDDIQILATEGGANVGIGEVTNDNLQLAVYPNPVTDNSVVVFSLPMSVSKALLSIYDIAGRHVARVYTGELPAGEQTFNIDRSRLGAGGVYFVKVNLDGKEFTKKVIVQ